MARFQIKDAEINEMSALLQSKAVADALACVQGMLEHGNVTLNVAVTGESGSGKSSFINAFRGIADDDKEAAETGVTETTREASVYRLLTAHNVLLWDLPGIGTPSFRPESYLEDVGLLNYDFFIIVCAQRFQECHTELARAILKSGKKFYFVRNKVDRDLKANSRRNTRQPDEDVLRRMRADCERSLENGGVEHPKVFLTSCFQPRHFDFPLLQKTLLDELEGHKRHALLLSLPVLNPSLIESKRNALAGEVWKKAIVACLGAVIKTNMTQGVIPSLMDTLKSYQQTFGLDTESLCRLASLTGKPLQDLQNEVLSTSGKELTAETVEGLLSQAASVQHLLANELEKRVPFLGTIATSGISFVASYYLLSSALKDLSEDAERVMRKAFS
ncbi:interferon-inducible GTPase 5-like [Chanos chanos]|uniref:Interferon-inducible GTPase 5-like n=1 Tax=Chanos chanos TaxID=29144 RepID=A0A6J2WCW6_CHACN|nr:interferon-inducible GTPase 5-like [Chanos chanos]